MLKTLWRGLKGQRKAKGNYYTGPYSTWTEATRDSHGWDNDDIVEKRRIALGKVRDGEAVYERDFRLFDKIQYSYGLLAGLLRAASEFENQVTVLDFGGALGTSYFQCRSFLEPLSQIQWWVVDQGKQVECGKREFTNDQLHFGHTVEEVLQHARPNVLLVSGVLQYLEDPYAMLDKLLGLRVPYLILERTPFLAKASGDILLVQHVPPAVYEAAFPSWQFDPNRLLERIKVNYMILTEFEAQPPHVVRMGEVVSAHRGLIARHKR